MKEFTCAVCNNSYETHSTEKEKEEEFQENYNHSMADSDEELVSLCDYCYDELSSNDGINIEYRKLQEKRAKELMKDIENTRIK